MSSRGMPVTQAIRAERRARAESMKKEYDKLSLEEKLARLPKDGANKQRARLSKKTENKIPESQAVVENPIDSPKTKISKTKDKKEDK